MTLAPGFLDRPIAHRGLHDPGAGRIENSRAAMRAAVAAGYGIELDLQLSADGVAMVFHDTALGRLTGAEGPVRARRAAELGAIRLTGGDEGIPTLAEVLENVGGRVPLLVEIKDQDGALGPDVGPLEAATAQALAGYDGPVAVMSFNPHSMAAMARLAPGIARGLTTCAFDAAHWSRVPDARRQTLAEIADLERVGASFVSHHWPDLGRARVRRVAAALPVLAWTIRSAAEEAEARALAVNVTFEGYLPA